MFRLILILALIAVGYDAVVHQGTYTRNIWTNLVGLTDSAVNGARQFGQNAHEESQTHND
jgi:hypothetical protein